MRDEIDREVAKHWWLRCVSCSEAAMTTQMRGFGAEDPAYEQAAHTFSGGFLHRGDACGVLSGSALAAGFQARLRFDDDEAGSAAALHATVRLAAAYAAHAGSVDCRDITGASLVTVGGRLRYIWRHGGPGCGRLHLGWASRAHRLIDEALTGGPTRGGANCAASTMRSIASSPGMTAGDSVIVAGLAGGIGLSGNVCGALATGIFALALKRYRRRGGGKRDSRLRAAIEELSGASYRGAATELRTAFEARFGSSLCLQIVDRRFRNPAEHSAFIEPGGCRAVIEFVAREVAG